MASRFKEAEPLTSKDSAEVASALKKIFKRGPLKWPQLLQVDPGREFMGAVTEEMEKHKPKIRRGRTERLFGHQYAVEVTRLIGKKPSEAIEKSRLFQALYSLPQTCWPAQRMASLRRCGCGLSLPTQRALRWKEKSDRPNLVIESVLHRKNHHQTQ